MNADDSSASSSESSEESLTKEDVQKMRADLNKVLPANIANRICDVFAEFADNASNENTTKASVCDLSDELMKLFEYQTLIHQ